MANGEERGGCSVCQAAGGKKMGCAAGLEERWRWSGAVAVLLGMEALGHQGKRGSPGGDLRQHEVGIGEIRLSILGLGLG